MTVLSDVSLPQINVLGSPMAFREAGDRDAPVALFLHGNPTSSYIWRNILPPWLGDGTKSIRSGACWRHVEIICLIRNMSMSFAPKFLALAVQPL